MIHLGDITKIDGSKILPVDVIIGGSPCQDLSIAGKREGLSGERSGLFMEQIRIIKEMHKEYGTVYPRFMVWENVPGALSSNKGEDFRIVLEETARIAEADAVIPRPPKGKWKNSGCIMGDGWSIAWRILDAQFWGVPQRRRRIVLVADFGGESAPEILFERKGVSGSTPQGFRSWQGVAGTFEEGSGAAGCVCLNDQGGSRMDVTEDVAATLRAETHGHPTCVMVAAGSAEKRPDRAVYDARGNGDGMTAPTLTGDHQNRVTDYTAICVQKQLFSRQRHDEYKEGSLCSTISARDYKSATDLVVDSVDSEYVVRRLTPLECERLQGFPDGWTDIGNYIDTNGKKKKSSDTARYKALGNSIALPPWRWVLKRLCNQYDRCVTMGSLFDGIGGFPLIWEEINGRGNCLWASEIEEFPIAVTKRRFSQ